MLATHARQPQRQMIIVYNSVQVHVDEAILPRVPGFWRAEFARSAADVPKLKPTRARGVCARTAMPRAHVWLLHVRLVVRRTLSNADAASY